MGRRVGDSPRDAARPLGIVQQPVFSPDGGTLYTASHDGTAIAWDIDGRPRAGAAVHVHARPGVSTAVTTAPGRVQPGRPADRGRPQGGGIQLWDANDLDPVWRAPCSRPAARSRRSPSVRTGERSRPSPERQGDALGRRLAIAPLGTGSTAPSGGSGVSFSADGTMLATAGEEGVRLWDVATGAALGRIGDAQARRRVVAFSPTEPLLAFSRRVERRDATGGRGRDLGRARRSRIRTLRRRSRPEESSAIAVAFSPDGRMLATGGSTLSCTSGTSAPASSSASSSRTWAVR